MKLLPIDSPGLVQTVSEWLAREENYKWLDFGNGVQILPPAALRVMTQRDIHVLRVFTSDDREDLPVGVVGLSNVDRRFKTASIWFVLGDKQYGGRTARAASMLLSQGFNALGLQAIHAWTIETNLPSLRCIRRLNFRCVGSLRRSHYIDGRPYDRLLFDLLATEHKEIPDA